LETLNGIADDKAGMVADGVAVLSFAQAQKKARELFSMRRGTGGKVRGALTVRQACEEYVAYLKAEKKTGDDAEKRLNKHVVAKLGDKVVSALTKNELERWKRGMVRTDAEDPDVERASKDSANRVLTSFKAALNMAFNDDENDIPTDAAWRKVKPFRDVGRSREVHLDVAQTKRLIQASGAPDTAFRRLVTAASLTGARAPHELAAVRVRDFHADLGTLAVDGKTGKRDIVLTSEAVTFFKSIAAGRAPDDLLLPKGDGSPWGKNHHVRPMKEAVARAKLPAGTTIYTLRHSHASQAILAGINLQLLAENLGTSVRMLEQHYGKFMQKDRRKLIEAATPKLGIRPSRKVVPFAA
jgi:integrase